jgi:uncharacterized protein (DUF2267 family)
MTTKQTLTFADALPPLPRAIFLEGLRPADRQPLTSASDFLHGAIGSLSPHYIPPPSIVTYVFAVLAERLESADARTMREQLPDQLKPISP